MVHLAVANHVAGIVGPAILEHLVKLLEELLEANDVRLHDGEPANRMFLVTENDHGRQIGSLANFVAEDSADQAEFRIGVQFDQGAHVVLVEKIAQTRTTGDRLQDVMRGRKTAVDHERKDRFLLFKGVLEDLLGPRLPVNGIRAMKPEEGNGLLTETILVDFRNHFRVPFEEAVLCSASLLGLLTSDGEKGKEEDQNSCRKGASRHGNSKLGFFALMSRIGTRTK